MDEKRSETKVTWAVIAALVAKYLGVDAAMLAQISDNAEALVAHPMEVNGWHLVVIGVGYLLSRTGLKSYKLKQLTGKSNGNNIS